MEPCSHSRGKTTCNEITHGDLKTYFLWEKVWSKRAVTGESPMRLTQTEPLSLGGVGGGDRVKSVIAETLGEGEIAAGASRGIISHHTAAFSEICSSCGETLKPL